MTSKSVNATPSSLSPVFDGLGEPNVGDKNMATLFRSFAFTRKLDGKPTDPGLEIVSDPFTKTIRLNSGLEIVSDPFSKTTRFDSDSFNKTTRFNFDHTQPQESQEHVSPFETPGYRFGGSTLPNANRSAFEKMFGSATSRQTKLDFSEDDEEIDVNIDTDDDIKNSAVSTPNSTKLSHNVSPVIFRRTPNKLNMGKPHKNKPKCGQNKYINSTVIHVHIPQGTTHFTLNINGIKNREIVKNTGNKDDMTLAFPEDAADKIATVILPQDPAKIDVVKDKDI
jgi:hypothetical protein